MKPLQVVALGAVLLVFGASACRAAQTLTKVVDVPLPGRASRFDYQSFDPTSKTLYFTHMSDGEAAPPDRARRRCLAYICI